MTPAYHHGNLREAVLDRAAEVIAAQGPHALNLRSLAAELGVSHTAPRHHFGGREGVLNALAVQGHTWLADYLRESRAAGGSFLDAGVAYVRFAVDHPGHFQVMFTPTLLDQDDPTLAAASAQTFAELTGGVSALEAEGRVTDAAGAVLAGWSLVHGLATLALSGNLDAAGIRSYLGVADLADLARRAAGMLFSPPSSERGALS